MRVTEVDLKDKADEMISSYGSAREAKKSSGTDFIMNLLLTLLWLSIL